MTSFLIEIASITVTIVSIGIALFQIYSERKDFNVIGQARRTALKGKWVGGYTQENKIDNKFISGNIELVLIPGRRLIKGTAEMSNNFGHHSSYKINGGFKFERFLTLSYDDRLGHISQFGFFLFELSPDAATLEGKALGFGPQSRKIINAKITLTRKQEG